MPPTATRDVSALFLTLVANMPRRFLAGRVATLLFISISSTISAQTPLLVDELTAEAAIASGELQRAVATRDLAAWKMSQLSQLRELGHASWQEVALQVISLKSADAHAVSAKRYLRTVRLQQAATNADKNPMGAVAEFDSVHVYVPGSPRLAASIPIDAASVALLRRHLQYLTKRRDALSEIELPEYQAEVDRTRRITQSLDMANRNESHANRAAIQQQLAKAEYTAASARKASSEILSRRIAHIQTLLENERQRTDPTSVGLTEIGTRLIDASAEPSLTNTTRLMTASEGMAAELDWLEHRHESLVSRIDALRELSDHPQAPEGELRRAEQAKSDLVSQIRAAREAETLHQRIADQYETESTLVIAGSLGQSDVPMDLSVLCTDAGGTRHWLGLSKLSLELEAQRSTVVATIDYLTERKRRLEKIAETARPPKELKNLCRQIVDAQLQVATFDHHLETISTERVRFGHQVKAQRGSHYQLVQLDDGHFIGREPFMIAKALITTIGMVGDTRFSPRLPTAFPYIESASLLEQLSTTVDGQYRTSRPACRSFVTGISRQVLHRTTRYSVGDVSPTYGVHRFGSYNFCDAPFRLNAFESHHHVPHHDLFRYSRGRDFATFAPYQRYPWGRCGLSIFSYRVGFPTRSSFPYRSSYLYRTAFPSGHNLHGNPQGGWTSRFQGQGYAIRSNGLRVDRFRDDL